jgi:hypothetical protein
MKVKKSVIGVRPALVGLARRLATQHHVSGKNHNQEG